MLEQLPWRHAVSTSFGLVHSPLQAHTNTYECVNEDLPSRSLTVRPWKSYHPKRKLVFQTSCFRVYVKLGGGFKYFYFHPYLGKIPILTNIFQMGWNHQPVNFRGVLILSFNPMGGNYWRSPSTFPRWTMDAWIYQIKIHKSSTVRYEQKTWVWILYTWTNAWCW